MRIALFREKLAANTLIWGKRVNDLPVCLLSASAWRRRVEYSQRPENLGR